MPDFNWKDLVNPQKIAANGQWIVVGVVAGIVAYHFLNPYLNPEIAAYSAQPVHAIQVRSPTMGMEPQTATYGCSSCGSTRSF
jgi:hypothetical protein